MKYPLPEVVVIHNDPKILNNVTRLENYIKEELNVKTVVSSHQFQLCEFSCSPFAISHLSYISSLTSYLTYLILSYLTYCMYLNLECNLQCFAGTTLPVHIGIIFEAEVIYDPNINQKLYK